MPTINAYYSQEEQWGNLDWLTPYLRPLVAQQLSHSERKLTVEDVSMRLIPALGSTGMIAPVEFDIVAEYHPERALREDDICIAVRDFVLGEIDDLEDARAWLQLPAVGYSFTRTS